MLNKKKFYDFKKMLIIVPELYGRLLLFFFVFFHFWRWQTQFAIVKKSQDILKFRFGVQWKIIILIWV